MEFSLGKMIGAGLLAVIAACAAPAPVVQQAPPVPYYAAPVSLETSDDTTGDSTCFLQVNDDQRAQLGEIVPDTSSGGAVCVLEPDGDGGFEQHYYGEQDHFADYFLYSRLLRGSGNALFTYGVISGDLSALDYVMLSALVGVDSRGGVYYPYTRDVKNGSWTRHKSMIEMPVKRTRFGASAPQPYVPAKQVTPPSGYSTQRPLAAPTAAAIKQDAGPQRGEKPKASTPTPAPSKANSSSSSSSSSSKGTTSSKGSVSTPKKSK